jgi:hypothetical protein
MWDARLCVETMEARLMPSGLQFPVFTPVSAQARTLGALGSNPNPEDPSEPHGPGTPVIRVLNVAAASPAGAAPVRVWFSPDGKSPAARADPIPDPWVPAEVAGL